MPLRTVHLVGADGCSFYSGKPKFETIDIKDPMLTIIPTPPARINRTNKNPITSCQKEFSL
jgi:hypothetical protein